MRTTVDGAGRIVIPKPVREQAGLRAGSEVDVEFRDGRIEIEPTTTEMRLVDDAAAAVIVAAGGMPLLTTEQVRDLLERARR
jgi:AbrB family looped-hinge helix DNA binding protein